MRNNILLLVVDCLRADVCYGKAGRAKTPTINALRNNGAAFSKMMAVTTTTTPSFASILTGYYPTVHGIRTLQGHKLSPNIQTLAERMKEAGYYTAAFVSGPLVPETCINRGFDYYEVRSGDTLIYDEWGKTFIDKIKNFDAPWFALVHLWELHTPRYVDKNLDTIGYGYTKYERALSSVDNKLREWLSILPMERTNIIITGDHGENYNPPLKASMTGLLNKIPGVNIETDKRYPPGLYHGYNLYDFLVNVPFIMNGPDIPRGKNIHKLASQVDIAPTLSGLAGAEGLNPNGYNGVNLLPLLSGGSIPDRPVFMEACGIVIPSENDWLRGVRTDVWKYIYAPRNLSIKPMLFNLENDPAEECNLVDKLPDKAAELRRIAEGMPSGYKMTLDGEKMTSREMMDVEGRLKSLGYM